MRVATVLAIFCLAAANAVPTAFPNFHDKAILEYQRDVLDMFSHVYQKSFVPRIVELASQFKIEEMKAFYTNEEAYEEFLYYYHKGFFPRQQVFSIFNEHQREEAIAYFNIFYYAKDFDTFIKTAAYVRQHVNEGMFVYSFYIALIHRPDCQGFYIPPVYEIFPSYFFNSEVFSKGEYLQMYQGPYDKSYFDFAGIERSGENEYYIHANYSGGFVKYNHEQLLTYFTEDIGLNQFYYFFHADYPFWMGGEEFGLNKDKRGEMFYYFHQQILARYYMERLSLGMGEIPTFNWEKPIKTGYFSSLAYPNGPHFATRPNYYYLKNEHNYEEFDFLNDYEERIRNVATYGYYLTPEGERVYLDSKDAFNTLGNIIQANPDSPNTKYYRYFLAIARSILGPSYEVVHNYFTYPTALEQFETTLRDPAFWQLYKRVLKYFFQLKKSFGPYTREELQFPGVNVKDVEVDKLVTFFDYYDASLYNGFYYSKDMWKNPKYDFYARQLRLNHKSFNVKIHVDSDKSTDAVIRIFLGPKYDSFGHEMSLDENNYNFFELDVFKYNLKSGQNIIERHSDDFFYFGDYEESYGEVYEKIEAAIKGSGEFSANHSEAYYKFPNRLMLPKGKKGGMPFTFYVIVSPYIAPEHTFYSENKDTFYSGVGSGAIFIDSRPLGFPFDREIADYFYFPNMYFKDVMIFHKTKYNLYKNYLYFKSEHVDDKFEY